MERRNETVVPAGCHYVVYQPVATFLLDRMDVAYTASKKVDIMKQKQEVCADDVEEKKKDDESIGSGIYCKCCKDERGKRRG